MTRVVNNVTMTHGQQEGGDLIQIKKTSVPAQVAHGAPLPPFKLHVHALVRSLAHVLLPVHADRPVTVPASSAAPPGQNCVVDAQGFPELPGRRVRAAYASEHTCAYWVRYEFLRMRPASPPSLLVPLGSD